MSLTRKIAHNSFLQIAGKIISTLLGLIAVALMTRYLGNEQFGWYVTATGFLQFIGIISDFGFTVTTSNMLAEPFFESTRVLNTLFTWRFITALVFNGLAPLLILPFPYPQQIKTAVAITSISFFALALNQVFIGYYRERLKMVTATLAELAGRVVLVAGVAFIVHSNMGFLPIMGTISLASVAALVYQWINIGTVTFELDKVISRAMFIKMWPTALSVIFNAVYLQGDRVILPLYVSQTIVGLYGAAYRVLDIVLQLAAIVMGLMMPLITYAWSRKQQADFEQHYQMGFNLLTLLLFPITVGGIVLAKPLMAFVAGDQFAGAGPILQWLSISILGSCFGMIFGHVALAINRQKEVLWIYGTDALLSLIGYFVLIPPYGAAGAIAVTIFSEFFAGIALSVATIRYSGSRPRLWTSIKILTASVLMGLGVWLIQPLPLIISIAIGGMTYAILIVLLRVISPAMLHEITTVSRVAERE